MNNLLLLTAKSDLLLVDDNRENLRLLATMLNDCGYKVRKALSGSLALRAVEIKQPDLIILDINMPHMNGYQVCEKLKSSSPNSKYTSDFSKRIR
jgi:CheY-like chemotaxis protein